MSLDAYSMAPQTLIEHEFIRKVFLSLGCVFTSPPKVFSQFESMVRE